MGQWHIYVVRAADGSLYTGIATNVERRMADHSRGGTKGSKYLRSRGPLELVYFTPIGSRALALSVEARIKTLTKPDKEQIVAAGPDRERLLEILAVDGQGT